MLWSYGYLGELSLAYKIEEPQKRPGITPSGEAFWVSQSVKRRRPKAFLPKLNSPIAVRLLKPNDRRNDRV
jgi:hypothetical protein